MPYMPISFLQCQPPHISLPCETQWNCKATSQLWFMDNTR